MPSIRRCGEQQYQSQTISPKVTDAGITRKTYGTVVSPRGSIDEILDDINVCIDENYGDQAQVNQLRTEAYALIGRINGYMAYLRRTQQEDP
jgi:hypothetical protein